MPEQASLFDFEQPDEDDRGEDPETIIRRVQQTAKEQLPA
jgi:hypothetical protein